MELTRSKDILGKAKAAGGIGWKILKHLRALTFSFKDFRFLSDRETLAYLKEYKVGIVRFGDGELSHLIGRPTRRQRPVRVLQEKLAAILSTYMDDRPFLVALPLDLIFQHEYEKRGASPRRWRVAKYAALPFLKRKQTYGSPFCFQLWNIAEEEKEGYTRLAKSLFAGREIVYIGNEDNIVDIRNIVEPRECIRIPRTEAFSSYEMLLNQTRVAVKKLANPLVLVTAGVTGTVLSAELNMEGILTYDVGKIFRRTVTL